jgi:hypothetical protein
MTATFFPESVKSGDRLIKRIRYGPVQAGTDHRPVKQTDETDITESASIMPVSDRTLERLPEGRRQDVEMQISTDVEIRTADPVENTEADYIKVIDNDKNTTEVYQVVGVERFGTFMPHYEAALLRAQEDTQ